MLLDIKPVFCFLVGSSMFFFQNMGLEDITSYLSKVSQINVKCIALCKLENDSSDEPNT